MIGVKAKMFNNGLPKSFFPNVDMKENFYAIGVGLFEVKQGRLANSQASFIMTKNYKEEFENPLELLLENSYDIVILKNALRNSIKMRRLSDEYICLLQEKLSDEAYNEVAEEYEKIAAPYAFKARSISSNEIAIEAKVVLNAFGDDLGSDEIADVLELDVLDVENSLAEHSS